MFGRGKLKIAAVSAGVVTAVFGVLSIPASAEPCTVTLTILGGAPLTFNLDLPPGVSVNPRTLTALPVASVTQTCQSASASHSTNGPGTTTTRTTTTGSSSGSSPSSGPSTPTVTPQPPSHGGRRAGKPGHPSTHGKPGANGSKPNGKPGSGGIQTTPKPAATRGVGGVPTFANPTFSFALPGPAPVGVPNFFIDSFRIPPFLLPIYQAAGIQYNVPWQVLAAINEIETDYGRNLSVSSAGAVGWMQFLPSTFKQWGVDANGDGVKDPYNPVDAIFSAARYLSAAGASKNLHNAIFAYNHAEWYVQSVLLRGKLIGGIPSGLIGALTGLVQGHFPVAAKARYADDSVDALAHRRVRSGNAAVPVGSTTSRSVSVYAKQNSPVIAVNDGRIVKVGHDRKLGRFVQLQDQTGNVYTYAGLGSIPRDYAVPKPVKVSTASLAKALIAPALPSPTQAASAGQQQTSAASVPSTQTATKVAKASAKLPQATSTATATAPAQVVSAVKERLFAYPAREASYAAGGQLQLQSTQAQISSFQNYFSDTLHLAKDQYTLAPLKAGATVLAGTILGRLGSPSTRQATHLQFMIQPAGKKAPLIDPKPILDGWKLLEATAVYRASGIDPFFGPGAKNPTIGQILLMSKAQLQNRILQDPHVQIYPCGRRDIQAGLIDRRILATLEFLSASSLQPTVSALQCGQHTQSAGSNVEISKINTIPVSGHQGTGSITDIAIRRLLTLQGALQPDQIISQMSYKGQPNTLALPDHANRIQVTYTPLFGANQKLSAEIKTILQPHQWIDLINRISQIPQPTVSIAPSKYAVRTAGP